MYSLYQVIYELCAEKGVTPGKMCSELGISRGLITDLKMGRKHTATGVTLKKIGDYLGVSVDYLLTGDRQDTEDVDEDVMEQMMEALRDNEGMRLLFSKTKNASKEDIDKVIKMIDIMKGTNDE